MKYQPDHRDPAYYPGGPDPDLIPALDADEIAEELTSRVTRRRAEFRERTKKGLPTSVVRGQILLLEDLLDVLYGV